jgi:copper chaperone CopZ
LIGSVRIDSFSQPVTSSSYYSDYKFTAPIEGERLTIRYNLNRLIADVTSSLEKVRCITADVLVKESPTLSVNVSGEIIVNSDFTSEVNTVIENASNAVVNLLGSVRLGTTVDYSDIINVVTNVPGVDSVNISLFNESGSTGRRTYIKALDNQAISAGSVTFNSIARKDFRIT